MMYTHVGQQESIHFIVVCVEQKIQGLPGELGAGKSHRRGQDRPRILGDPFSSSLPTAQDSGSSLKGFPLFLQVHHPSPGE